MKRKRLYNLLQEPRWHILDRSKFQSVSGMLRADIEQLSNHGVITHRCTRFKASHSFHVIDSTRIGKMKRLRDIFKENKS